MNRTGLSTLAADLRANLGWPGILIGLFSLVCFVFGLIVLNAESGRLRQAGRVALQPVMSGWIRTVPVDYLGATLPDYADRYRQAQGTERPQRLLELDQALETLAGRFDPLVELVHLDLGAPGAPAVAVWPRGEVRSLDPADLLDQIPILPGSPPETPMVLRIRYRFTPVVSEAVRGLEVSQRRLVLSVLVLSAFPLLCLIYMLLQARALQARAAHEAAQAATLELADRTCHELGNVAFVLSNEQRNLREHLDQVEQFVDAVPPLLGASGRVDPKGASGGTQPSDRFYRQHGLPTPGALQAGGAMAREVCEQIDVCARYISLMVRELDGFLRHSALPADPRPTAATACLEDALAILGPRIQSAGVRLIRPAPGELPEVLADRRLLVHALINLLKNAVEAVADTPDPEIRLSAAMEAGQLALSVVDNGPGLAQEALARVFDRGYSTKGPGRGRGLIIARDAVEAQRGKLTASSIPGHETRFTIHLPLAPDSSTT